MGITENTDFGLYCRHFYRDKMGNRPPLLGSILNLSR
jgi:hypothetical protein